MSTDDEMRTALGLDSDDPASALELARQAWEPYFSYTGQPGVINEECVYTQMVDALILVGNDIREDDEEMFEAASEGVTLRPENLDLKLVDEMGESYQEAARVIAYKHRRNLIELLLTLGLLYSNEKNRHYVRDWERARDSFDAFDDMTQGFETASSWERDMVTRDKIQSAHRDLKVLDVSLAHFADTLYCAREQLLRMELLAKARVATYRALAQVTRAVYWMDEHRG